MYSEWSILHRLNHLTDVIYSPYSDMEGCYDWWWCWIGEFRLWSSRRRTLHWRFRRSRIIKWQRSESCVDLSQRGPVPCHCLRQWSHGVLTVSDGVVHSVSSCRARQWRSRRGTGGSCWCRGREQRHSKHWVIWRRSRRALERACRAATWRSGRGRNPWERRLSTRSHNRETRGGGGGARIWAGVSSEESSVVVDKSFKKRSPTCFWKHYYYKTVIVTSSFFATLTTLNVCHGAEGVNKTFFLILTVHAVIKN